MDRASAIACPAPAEAGFFAPSEPAEASLHVVPRPRLATRRHLLGLEGTSRERILELLDAAGLYREKLRAGRWRSDALRGVAVCNAFFEDSTRTRVSFELAAQRLGAMHVTFGESGTSVSKGESLLDTLRVVTSMGVDAVIVRHRSSGVPGFLARHLDASVINAGDGEHEHPTQGLLDLMTLRDAWGGRFEGKRLAIVGDIAHSRVARSAIRGLNALGATVTVCGPGTLMPRDIESPGCTIAPTLEDALENADAAMALRLQRERMERGLLPSLAEYSRVWGLTAERARLMKEDAVVMHPGPMNRGVEIMPDVADGGRSVIFDQTANGLAVRCAVLSWCVTGDAEAAV
ncbi:MAG TPA: aspartate carbamoyltransferase catalytic subunit [Candidatus Udaeobacter sp.]|jgi:aspartate carbamoyltransferase catalytic subunit|nr:aspartate carbamoyltransferase catalytic subunit [Candidatus Udaeobacter sp.]